MNQINYKSDFDFILRLHDCEGNEVGWPGYDWQAKIWTRQKVNAFVASCIGGEAVNCYNDDGKIHIVASNHRLGPGQLKIEFIAELPNANYPDNAERIVVPVPIEIELISTAAPCHKGFDVELILPMIKGEPFTYADFTPEQIAELQRPAREAAEKVAEDFETAEAQREETFTTNLQQWTQVNESMLGVYSRKEQERDNAERQRQQQEQARQTNEDIRNNAEEIRRSQEGQRYNNEIKRANAEFARAEAETSRVKAEATRVEAERLRETAEEKRATEFAGFKGTIDAKADVEDLSNVYGEPTSVDSNDKFEALTGFTREDMKKDLFIDLWEHLTWGYWHDLSQPEQCGGYNKATDLFWLYDIHDISYEEALEIAAIGAPIINGTSFSISVFVHMRRPHRFRTHLPIKSSASNLQFTGDHTFWNCPIEQIVLPSVNARNYFLHNCTVEKLRCYTLASGIASTSCRNLREIVLMCPDNSMARGNFSFIGSPGLTQPSVKMIVDKMKPDSISPVAITVHPDVFAKLTDEANAEWHQVLTDAIEKNIQFATV